MKFESLTSFHSHDHGSFQIVGKESESAKVEALMNKMNENEFIQAVEFSSEYGECVAVMGYDKQMISARDIKLIYKESKKAAL